MGDAFNLGTGQSAWGSCQQQQQPQQQPQQQQQQGQQRGSGWGGDGGEHQQRQHQRQQQGNGWGGGGGGGWGGSEPQQHRVSVAGSGWGGEHQPTAAASSTSASASASARASVPIVNVSGRLFAVETCWIEEAFALLDPQASGFRPCAPAAGAEMDLSPAAHTAAVGGCEWELNSSRPRVSTELVDMICRLILAIDTHDRHHCTKSTASTSTSTKGAVVRSSKQSALIFTHLFRPRGCFACVLWSQLVFMPGFGEIQSLMRALEQWCGRGRLFVAVPLHSQVAREEQQQACELSNQKPTTSNSQQSETNPPQHQRERYPVVQSRLSVS